jgi:ubiquinone/menaquinone biosynthesis C-methylase UbiE
MSAAAADQVFADPAFTRSFLEHLKTSPASHLSHQWLRGQLEPLLRLGQPYTVVDMGCGLNKLAALPVEFGVAGRCEVIGLDRHDMPGVLKGKLESPPLADHSSDALVYSLSLYGTAADQRSYLKQAARVLRPGGHLYIVEPASSFTTGGLVRYIGGLQQCGFELVGKPKEMRGENETLSLVCT